MRYIEERGRTAEEALQRALEKTGIPPEEAVYEVVRDGLSGGFALVRLYTEIPELDTIEQVVTEFMEKLGAKAEIEVMPKRTKYYVNIRTRRMDSALIGKGGKTLDALDYLLNLLIKRKVPDITVEIDVSGYKERKRQFLINKARAIARRVRETGREMRMDPLTVRESRLVRNALKKEKGIRTYTVGRGDEKVLVIAPAPEQSATPNESSSS